MEKTVVTVGDLEIFLKYYLYLGNHDYDCNLNHRESVDRLVSLGLLEPGNHPGWFKVTDRGAAWLAVILKVEPPELRWINQDGQTVAFRPWPRSGEC
jgi:hypothetical protein